MILWMLEDDMQQKDISQKTFDVALGHDGDKLTNLKYQHKDHKKYMVRDIGLPLDLDTKTDRYFTSNRDVSSHDIGAVTN